MIVSPSTLADIARIRTMRLQGTSSLLRNPFMTWINCASCIDSYVVHLRIIPDDIFESMGLREALAEQSPDNLLPLFEKIRMSPTDSVHREFVTKYCPHILGKWE
jgi:hypothetical protein